MLTSFSYELPFALADSLVCSNRQALAELLNLFVICFN